MNENLFKLTQRRRNLLISPVLNVLVVCEAQACASSTPPFLWDTHVCFFKSFFFVTRLQLVPKSSPRLLNCHRFFSENLCKLNILSSNLKARPCRFYPPFSYFRLFSTYQWTLVSVTSALRIGIALFWPNIISHIQLNFVQRNDQKTNKK